MININKKNLSKLGFKLNPIGHYIYISANTILYLINDQGLYLPKLIQQNEISELGVSIVELKYILYIHEVYDLYRVLNGEDLEVKITQSIKEYEEHSVRGPEEYTE